MHMLVLHITVLHYLCIDVYTGLLDKELENIVVAQSSCNHQWGVVLGISAVHVSTSIQQ